MRESSGHTAVVDALERAMTLLATLFLILAIGALVATGLLARSRGRLALELAATQERFAAPLAVLVAPSEPTTESEDAPHEVARGADDGGDEAQRSKVESESEVEEQLRRELAAARSQQALGAAEIARLREEARLGVESAAQGERALSAISAQGVGAVEALRLAEEEARVARIAKDSFAGESRLLREELRRVTARLADATRGGKDASPAAAPLTAQPALAGSVSVWWCNACNRGGNKPEPCCANAR